VGVAHGSNEELAKDFQDFLGQNNFQIWEKDDSRVRVFREFRVRWISQNSLNISHRFPKIPKRPPTCFLPFVR